MHKSWMPRLIGLSIALMLVLSLLIYIVLAKLGLDPITLQSHYTVPFFAKIAGLGIVSLFVVLAYVQVSRFLTVLIGVAGIAAICNLLNNQFARVGGPDIIAQQGRSFLEMVVNRRIRVTNLAAFEALSEHLDGKSVIGSSEQLLNAGLSPLRLRALTKMEDFIEQSGHLIEGSDPVLTPKQSAYFSTLREASVVVEADSYDLFLPKRFDDWAYCLMALEGALYVIPFSDPNCQMLAPTRLKEDVK